MEGEVRVFLSVVSHCHAKIIVELNSLSQLAADCVVVVKENFEKDFLEEYCADNNIIYLNENCGLGFGANNNYIFEYCRKNLGMKDSDVFVVCNPDVKITRQSIADVVGKVVVEKKRLVGINLYKDNELKEYDNSIRNFPGFSDFVSSFLGIKNGSIINKRDCSKDLVVDWFAGSFMAFEVRLFSEVSGFDEKYFMYCEDVDICFRVMRRGESAHYVPSIKAYHAVGHKNRKFLSRHFYWHLSSAFRFLLRYYRWRVYRYFIR